jgi:hypothetical protein
MPPLPPLTNDPGRGADADAGSPANADATPAGAPSDLASSTIPAMRSVPFVWQHGRQLLLLDEEPKGWVLAELRFDADRCRYVELRRATYRWPREATGALLSRLLATGQPTIDRVAQSLFFWVSSPTNRLSPAGEMPSLPPRSAPG